MHAAAMIEAAKSELFQDPDDVLSFRLVSYRIHHKSRFIDIDPVWTSAPISVWSSGSSSAFLLIQGSLGKQYETQAIGTHMARFIRAEQVAVLWALQTTARYQPVRTTPTQILKYLTMQALQLRHEAIGGLISQSCNQTRIASARSVEQWTTILSSVLNGLPLVYLVVDLDLVDPEVTIPELIHALSDLSVKCKHTALKIAVINKRRTLSVNLPLRQAAILDLERALPSEPRARASQIRIRSNVAMRVAGSVAFRSRLRGQNATGASI